MSAARSSRQEAHLTVTAPSLTVCGCVLVSGPPAVGVCGVLLPAPALQDAAGQDEGESGERAGLPSPLPGVTVQSQAGSLGPARCASTCVPVPMSGSVSRLGLGYSCTSFWPMVVGHSDVVFHHLVPTISVSPAISVPATYILDV